jgi:hypothetical protein
LFLFLFYFIILFGNKGIFNYMIQEVLIALGQWMRWAPEKGERSAVVASLSFERSSCPVGSGLLHDKHNK